MELALSRAFPLRLTSPNSHFNVTCTVSETSAPLPWSCFPSPALAWPKPYRSDFLLYSELELFFFPSVQDLGEWVKRSGAFIKQNMQVEKHVFVTSQRGHRHHGLNVSSGTKDKFHRKLCELEQSLWTSTPGTPLSTVGWTERRWWF